MTSIQIILAALVIASASVAQRTIIVDRNGGPGTDFTDLPPAVAVAQPGDTIILRASSYTPATVTRGITILGEGQPIVGFDLFAVPFRVTGVPANEAFVMKGVRLRSVFSRDARTLLASSCAGRIHFERVDITMGLPGGGIREYTAVGAEFINCAAVTLGESYVTGAPALRSEASNIAVQGGTLAGHDSSSFGLGASQSGSAAHVSGSSLILVSASAIAGRGLQGAFARPAIIATGATLTCGANSTFAAGAGMGTASALDGSGTLLLDPSVSLRPFGGAPPISPGITVTMASVPSLTATLAPLRGSISTSLYAPANDLMVVIASAPSLLIQAPPFGVLWFDPLGIFYAAAAVQGPEERWDHTFPISTSATRGLPIALQGASGPGLDLRVTTPCVVVLH